MNNQFQIYEESIKDRKFDWESSYFKHLNKTTFIYAERLLKESLIVDVYLENEIIVIEYLFNCKDDLKNIQNAIKNKENRSVSYFKIPKQIEVNENTKCKSFKDYSCEFYGCPIVLAAYIFHQRNHLKKEVIFQSIFSTKENNLFEKKEKLILDDEFKLKYKDLINNINNNFYISNDIKGYFINIIKILDNYIENKDILKIRPNLNLSISENTDTINNICFGQQKCIEQYLEILNYFNYIDNNEDIKYVNFKQLTDNDLITSENYKSNVIVLQNVYLLSNKNVISNEIQLKYNLIKENMPSYILNNFNKKTFIICDKRINIKNLYTTYNQLKVLFNNIELTDLKLNEINDIFIKKIENNKNIKLDENFKEDFKTYLENNYLYSPYKNMEFVEFLYNYSLSNLLESNDPKTINKHNLYIFKNVKNEDYLSLDKLIGLDNIKKEIKNLEAFLSFKTKKELKGDKMPQIDLHMCFLGNPGTGKTTVARLMAGILFNMGYIRYNKCLECEAKDLIANVTGETSLKTSEKIQEALGGVLFIDEAYALGESEYGKECIATLIKGMEDFREDLIVILAGYHKEMITFLEINSGFKSRIAYYLDFKDYTEEELLQMLESLLEEYNFKIADNATFNKLNILCTNAKKSLNFGNGRFVRNTVESILRQHAINNIESDENDSIFQYITEDDIKLY